MKHSTEAVTGNVVYSMVTEKERERDGFLSETILVLQISGQLILETSSEKISTKPGNILLLRKHQLVKVTKMPTDGQDYSTIIIQLSGDILRKYALENGVEIKHKYQDKRNIFIPPNQFLRGYFNSLIPYGDQPSKEITGKLGHLKVEEAIELLLYTIPELKLFLFDFSEQHKIDLEKFMLSNYQFNVPIEKIATLTGRSLASFKRDFQKLFGISPRQWLQDKRLIEARYLIESKRKRPSEIYLSLGFENLSHFSYAYKHKFGIAPTHSL